DNPEAFDQKAIELCTNAEVWKDNQNNGFKVLNQRFNKANFENDFVQKIKTLSTDLKTHRQSNFIGNVLQHQTLQSTKYLSKWIEEKNR
ncbi:MAG: glycosyltransferase, partial [Flavobacteriaceae bacterium]|nr:glycosyltransferase [Flavobacteriaceae bacterium]